MAKKRGDSSLLIEILTEELPPRSLRRLSESFTQGVMQGLREARLLEDGSTAEAFATPRRLAVRVTSVLARQADRIVERKGPPVQAALDASGKPTQALAGFARSCGADVSKLERRKDARGEYFLFRAQEKGKPLQAHLAAIVETALRKLPVAKLMRWGNHDFQFVRPVHGLILLHGSKVVSGEVLGLASGNRTRGHRFLGKGPVQLRNAAEYEKKLEQQGKVVAPFEARRKLIVAALDKAVAKLGRNFGWQSGKSDELLDEVTSIVEWPSVMAGDFDPDFLDVPAECLVLSMQQHQRYFPVYDGKGRLQPAFLFVANVPPTAGSQVAHGNARVLRARLSDAKFFYDQDRRQKLADRVPQLGSVVYHNKLGSQLERVQRIQKTAGFIARKLQSDAGDAERAAWLCKADLLTGMVGEFPELQGLMGRYYALHDGEPEAVADAIADHYRPRFAGDELPQAPPGIAVALAEKLDTLSGLFGIGEIPTGERDPFGLRRAAIGIVRMLIERNLALPLDELVHAAFASFGGKVKDAQTELESFLFDRLSGYLKDRGYTALEVDAVVSLRPMAIHRVISRLEAVRAFNGMPEAESLVAANKRVANILRQAAAKGESFQSAVPALLKENAERRLFEALQSTSGTAARLFEQGDFAGYLRSFAVLKAPVDAFFDSVMVMAEDAELRRNRLALLEELRRQMNRVADVARLAQ